MRPVSILMVVVLPAPFGPRKPKMSPCATSRLTSLTAWTFRPVNGLENVLARWSTRRMGGGVMVSGLSVRPVAVAAWKRRGVQTATRSLYWIFPVRLPTAGPGYSDVCGSSQAKRTVLPVSTGAVVQPSSPSIPNDRRTWRVMKTHPSTARLRRAMSSSALPLVVGLLPSLFLLAASTAHAQTRSGGRPSPGGGGAGRCRTSGRRASSRCTGSRRAGNRRARRAGSARAGRRARSRSGRRRRAARRR